MTATAQYVLRQPRCWPSRVASGTPTTLATVRPEHHAGHRPGAALRRHERGRDDRGDPEVRAVRQPADEPGQLERCRSSARAPTARCRPRRRPCSTSSSALRGSRRADDGEDRRADDDAQRVRRHEVAAVRDRGAEVAGDVRQHAHRRELGGADAEAAEGQRGQAEPDRDGPAVHERRPEARAVGDAGPRTPARGAAAATCRSRSCGTSRGRRRGPTGGPVLFSTVPEAMCSARAEADLGDQPGEAAEPGRVEQHRRVRGGLQARDVGGGVALPHGQCRATQSASRASRCRCTTAPAAAAALSSATCGGEVARAVGHRGHLPALPVPGERRPAVGPQVPVVDGDSQPAAHPATAAAQARSRARPTSARPAGHQRSHQSRSSGGAGGPGASVPSGATTTSRPCSTTSSGTASSHSLASSRPVTAGTSAVHRSPPPGSGARSTAVSRQRAGTSGRACSSSPRPAPRSTTSNGSGRPSASSRRPASTRTAAAKPGPAVTDVRKWSPGRSLTKKPPEP